MFTSGDPGFTLLQVFQLFNSLVVLIPQTLKCISLGSAFLFFIIGTTLRFSSGPSVLPWPLFFLELLDLLLSLLVGLIELGLKLSLGSRGFVALHSDSQSASSFELFLSQFVKCSLRLGLYLQIRFLKFLDLLLLYMNFCMRVGQMALWNIE